jgi:hypothetical protein
MKKYIFIVIFLLFGSIEMFSQTNISAEQLLGDWKIIKCEGDETEDDIIGSVFHFKPSGIVIADKPSDKNNQKESQKKGTWKVVGNNIVLYKEDENPDKDKGTTLMVTRFEGNMLFINDAEEGMTVVFERIKN